MEGLWVKLGYMKLEMFRKKIISPYCVYYMAQCGNFVDFAVTM